MKFLSALAVGLILAGSFSAEEVTLTCRYEKACDSGLNCSETTGNEIWILGSADLVIW